MAKGSDESPAFLWADEIVKREAADGRERRVDEGREGDHGDGEHGDSREDGNSRVQAILERQWTSDRMRRIMQQYSERLLGTRVGISVWR